MGCIGTLDTGDAKEEVSSYKVQSLHSLRLEFDEMGLAPRQQRYRVPELSSRIYLFIYHCFRAFSEPLHTIPPIDMALQFDCKSK